MNRLLFPQIKTLIVNVFGHKAPSTNMEYRNFQNQIKKTKNTILKEVEGVFGPGELFSVSKGVENPQIHKNATSLNPKRKFKVWR